MKKNTEKGSEQLPVRGIGAIAKSARNSTTKSAMGRDKSRSFSTEYNSINTDPQGSWTGVPDNPYEKPVQDADDL